MEILEVVLLTVAKLLGEYLIKLISCIGLSRAYLFFKENDSIYIQKKTLIKIYISNKLFKFIDS